MIDTQKYNGLKEKIDEKEKMLIESISNQVAESISDSISDSLGDISDTLSDANKKSQGLSESIGLLTQNVQTLNSFDFTEQFTKVKSSQEALEQASQDAKSVFEESKDVNNKLVEELTKDLKEWQLICDNLTGIVGNIDNENKSLENTISNIEGTFYSLSSINEEFMETMKNVESKQANIIDTISEQTSTSVENIVNRKLESSSDQLLTVVESSSKQLKQLIDQLSVLSNSIGENLNKIIERQNDFFEIDFKTKLIEIEEKHEKIAKTAPLSIVIAVMGGIIIILNVISLLT